SHGSFPSPKRHYAARRGKLNHGAGPKPSPAATPAASSRPDPSTTPAAPGSYRRRTVPIRLSLDRRTSPTRKKGFRPRPAPTRSVRSSTTRLHTPGGDIVAGATEGRIRRCTPLITEQCRPVGAVGSGGAACEDKAMQHVHRMTQTAQFVDESQLHRVPSDQD